MGAWLRAQALGLADGLPYGGQFDADITAGHGGDALYANAIKQNLVPSMTFSARGRPAAWHDLRRCGDVAHRTTWTGPRGAPCRGALPRVAAVWHRAALAGGQPGGGLCRPTGVQRYGQFTGTAVAGAPSGLAARVGDTTGMVHAAIYDDSLGPTALAPPAAADAVPPVLSWLSVSPRRFAVRRSAKHAAARGARIRWRLSEPGRVSFRIDRLRRGFPQRRRCVAHRPRSGKVRRCERLVRQGAFARTVPKGNNAMRFRGLVRSRALRPGRYRLTAIPSDAAGNRSRPKRGGVHRRAPLGAHVHREHVVRLDRDDHARVARAVVVAQVGPPYLAPTLSANV